LVSTSSFDQALYHFLCFLPFLSSFPRDIRHIGRTPFTSILTGYGCGAAIRHIGWSRSRTLSPFHYGIFTHPPSSYPFSISTYVYRTPSTSSMTSLVSVTVSRNAVLFGLRMFFGLGIPQANRHIGRTLGFPTHSNLPMLKIMQDVWSQINTDLKALPHSCSIFLNNFVQLAERPKIFKLMNQLHTSLAKSQGTKESVGIVV